MTIYAYYISIGKTTGAPYAGRKALEMEVIRKHRKWIMIAGLISIVLGYIFLGNNSISLAPVLLVLGYCILIPVALI